MNIKTIPVVTLRDLKYSKSENPVEIPSGTHLELFFSEKNHAKAVFMHNGIRRGLLVANLHATVKATNGTKFSKPPSLRKLERESNDGVCTTVTGKRVEPDGIGDDGSPSWLLVMGVI
jgi:hypothetical protein